MTIQGALYTALTSLQYQQAQSSVISNNVANANTAGYSARNLDPTEITYGGVGQGVSAGVIQRASNAALATASRQAGSASAYSQQMTDVLGTYNTALGSSSTSTSISGSMTGLQTALTALSASPGDITTQTGAVDAASDLVGSFHALDAAIRDGRETADQGIKSDVDQVNGDLDELAANEAAFKKASARGESTATYEDKRDSLIADIATKLPVKVSSNGDGSVSLSTDQGTTLYDGTAHKLSFTATPSIPSQLRLTADPDKGTISGLSGVTVDNRAIAMSQSGSIAANLQLRDVTLAGFADQLDQLAANTAVAFQDADPTVTAGATGLFTNAGAAVASTTAGTAGLASNIAVNALVDPDQGGSVTRVRDGVHAATEGQASDATTVNSYVAAMSGKGSYSASAGIPATSSLTAAASSISGVQQATYATWSSRNDTRTTQANDAATSLSNATGVNVDEQMQRLLLVQQSYAASSQVMQVAARMLDTLISTVGGA